MVGHLEACVLSSKDIHKKRCGPKVYCRSATMSGGTPYIGSKIGLVSKAQNRYEGILYTIDTVNSTVVLAKVKSFGTEGRPTDRPTPPKDDIYEYIIFRGSDIKDITLCEPPKSHHGLPQDPAIVQSSLGSPAGSYSAQGPFSPFRIPSYNQLAASSLLNQQYAAALGLGPGLQSPQVRRGPMVEQAVQTVPADKARQKRGSVSQDQRRDTSRPQRPRQGSSQTPRRPGPTGGTDQRRPSQSQNESNDENKPPSRRRQGARRSRNRGRGQLLVGSSKPSTLKFETDFDFDSANAQFNKEELDLEKELQDKLNIKDAEEAKQDPGIEIPTIEKSMEEDLFGPKCYYDKAKCFFDNISSDNKSRTTWAEERKLNVETFGVPGRFLRGRGFRGSFRGRRGQGSTQRLPSVRAASGRL